MAATELIELVELLETAVSPDVFIPCPAQAFDNVRVKTSCLKCPYHGGFIKVGPAAEKFSDIWRVRCAHPVDRRMIMVRT